jgi:hypothetical protein
MENWPASLHDLSLPSEHVILTREDVLVLGSAITELGSGFDISGLGGIDQPRADILARLDAAVAKCGPERNFRPIRLAQSQSGFGVAFDILRNLLARDPKLREGGELQMPRKRRGKSKPTATAGSTAGETLETAAASTTSPLEQEGRVPGEYNDNQGRLVAAPLRKGRKASAKEPNLLDHVR